MFISGYIHINTITIKQSVAGVAGPYTLNAIDLGDGKYSTTTPVQL
jgi:hypothetical protein